MSISVELAQKVYGRDFLGEEAVRGMFLPQMVDASKTDLSPQELIMEQSRARGEFLIQRVDKAPDGSPLTMHKMQELLQPRFDQAKLGKVLYDTTWYQDEPFFMEETPRVGLVVVSKAPIKGSIDKTYHGQTQALDDYVRGIFEGRDLSKTAIEALKQWEEEKEGLLKLQNSNWVEAAKELSQLVINRSFRERAAEAMLSAVAPVLRNGERRLVNLYTWTNSLSSGGSLVDLGNSGPGGLGVDGWTPRFGRPGLGVCFSAAVEDLVS